MTGWSYRRHDGKDYYYPVGAVTDAVRIWRHIEKETPLRYTYTLLVEGKPSVPFRKLKDAMTSGDKILGLR
jgi:hypothetical protein